MNTPVNFKVAKLLEEKGFDKSTEANWCSDGYSTGMWKEVVDKQSITDTFEV